MSRICLAISIIASRIVISSIWSLWSRNLLHSLKLYYPSGENVLSPRRPALRIVAPELIGQISIWSVYAFARLSVSTTSISLARLRFNRALSKRFKPSLIAQKKTRELSIRSQSAVVKSWSRHLARDFSLSGKLSLIIALP